MRRTGSVAAALAMAGAVAAAGTLGFPARPAPAKRFVVRGHVDGLLPGRSRWLAATVRNPYGRPLRLLSLSAEVRRASGSCAASNLEVRPFRGRLTIRPRRARVVRLRVRMPITAAPECQGARFPLVFRGRASLA